jgi:hypothetical protein
VVCCEATSTAAEAASLMRERHVGDVVVLAAERYSRIPIEVITDRDLVVERRTIC